MTLTTPDHIAALSKFWFPIAINPSDSRHCMRSSAAMARRSPPPRSAGPRPIPPHDCTRLCCALGIAVQQRLGLLDLAGLDPDGPLPWLPRIPVELMDRPRVERLPAPPHPTDLHQRHTCHAGPRLVRVAVRRGDRRSGSPCARLSPQRAQRNRRRRGHAHYEGARRRPAAASREPRGRRLVAHCRGGRFDPSTGTQARVHPAPGACQDAPARAPRVTWKECPKRASDLCWWAILGSNQ